MLESNELTWAAPPGDSSAVKTVVMVLGVATTLLAVWGLSRRAGLWNSLFGWSFADQRGG